MRRALIVVAFIAALVAVSAIADPAAASAAPCGAAYWPSDYTLDAVRSGDDYRVDFNFTLNQQEAEALRGCPGDWLEVDFPLTGFDIPTNWDEYRISSDIKNAQEDISWPDADPMPAATLIWTGDLAPGVWYNITLSFDSLEAVDANPTVGLRWVPSHWSRQFVESPKEAISCNGPGGSGDIGDPAWCIFGNDYQNVDMGWMYFRFNNDDDGSSSFALGAGDDASYALAA